MNETVGITQKTPLKAGPIFVRVDHALRARLEAASGGESLASTIRRVLRAHLPEAR
jgi:hypothetical protein